MSRTGDMIVVLLRSFGSRQKACCVHAARWQVSYVDADDPSNVTGKLTASQRGSNHLESGVKSSKLRMTYSGS